MPWWDSRARRTIVSIGALVGAFGMLLVVFDSSSRAQQTGPCVTPANEIVEENCKSGNPAREWDVNGAGSQSIQGFATDMSVDQGETVRFKVETDASDYRLDVYRMGYYGGDGARKVATVEPSASLPHAQPECETRSDVGLVDCGTWGVSASWQVPADAVSGIYFAKLVREDATAGASHVVFVVRDDDGNSDLLFQTSDTTWQAYNQYGGNSLYVGGPGTNPGRAYKVSYNRPFTTRGTSVEDWLFNSEYPMVRWLERNGYDVSYFTGVDSDRLGAEIKEHRSFLSVGHDEYWSGTQRENVEAARDAGVNLAFFSGNEVFWKTRWEDSHRTLVSYKETHANNKIDPTSEWTGTFRDPRAFNPEGPEPENALTGTIFTVNCCSYPMKVPAEDGKMRLWRDTAIANQSPGQTATLPDATLGYEWDEDLDNGSRPAGLVRMSSTTVDVPERITDHGSNYASGTATHSLTLYRDENGSGPDALVFGAGTVQWPWGLDGNHDRSGGNPDPRMQQATVNLLADMGVQPASLETGSRATASNDNAAPSSQITSPESGGEVQEGKPITITGTASDGDAGGVVGGVEVSVNGGQTWNRADGRENWRYTWTPRSQGQVTIQSRATDDSGNLESPSGGREVTVVPRAPAACPCSIWDDTATPANPSENDTTSVELGVTFRSDTDGYVTGVRFYKSAQNTGTHVGHLWTKGGEQLAEATFTGETASGWQEVRFDNPVQITRDTTYIASYHTTVGHYAADSPYFTAGGVDNPPLQALSDGADGPNGVYKYGPAGSFPNDSYNSSNYWVDVVFETSVGSDTTPPAVRSVSPTDGQTGVGTSTVVNATFNEAMDAGTIGADTFELRDAAGNVVSANVAYDPGSRTVTLNPSSPLDNSRTYTATVKGGQNGVKDAAGNPLESDETWSFTTAAPPPPPPDEGPGGPIAVIGNASNPFGRYYAEILRNEGLNEFTATDISSVNSATLGQYDTVILGDMPLTDAQVSMFTEWVNGGGNLVAMSPDPKLGNLLGLTNASGTLSEGYLKVDGSSAPGKGIVNETIQFHGTADRYSTGGGARAVATLYSSASDATQNPAVTLRDVGVNGGQAAAFTYDLARSIVYTRQGNPEWAGDERDGQSGPIRSDDLFYGAKAGDVKPDWVNLDKVAIPQADEQQRLLANLIGEMNLDKKPLPRFWYFPRGEEAVVIMTGDDHANNGTAGQFDWFKSQSPQGCSVSDWECIRSTSYIYPNTPLDPARAEAYENDGFEVALHVSTNCENYTPQSLEANYSSQLAAMKAKYASLDAPVTNRTHCIAWSDWATQPKVSLAHGIRLDTNYYYWPESWIKNRPGMFTGSGMPMRFADEDGKMIDVYQATTQMTDESGQTQPFNIDALLDKALGPQGYYGAFTTNMHTDRGDHSDARAIVNSAKSRGVPVVSARQMLEWLDGRNGSSFENIRWSADTDELTFTVSAGSGANGLQAMVPVKSDNGTLAGLTRDGSRVDTTKKTIKGVEYALFSARAGDYAASYGADTQGPAISVLKAEPGTDGSATISWSTDEASDSRVEYGTSPNSLDQNASDNARKTSHTIRLTGLMANTTYYYRVSSADAEGNSTTAPPQVQDPASFEMPPEPPAGFTDTTTSDFTAGTPGDSTYVSETGNGEVLLRPEFGAEFSGSGLPTEWFSSPWSPGGTSLVSGGALSVDGACAGTGTASGAECAATGGLYGPGRSLEFVATFGAAAFQHAGFGVDYNNVSRWAMFSTGGGDRPVGLYARTLNGSSQTNTQISEANPSTPHRYRIEWKASEVVYYVDGNEVARHAISITEQMRPLVSDYENGGPKVVVDWLRMSPYASAGAFTSRAFDAENQGAEWLKLVNNSRRPDGTSVSFETRSGESATPDDSWSSWEAVASDGEIASPPGRYVQYRANLSATGDRSASPAVEDVTLNFWLDETAPDRPSKPDLAAESDSGASDSDDVTNATTPTLTGTAESGSTVEVFADGVSLGTAKAGRGGNWSFTVPDEKALGEGTYSISAQARDGAGNVSDRSDALSIVVDTTRPGVGDVSPLPQATSVPFGTDVSATFSEEMDASTMGDQTFTLSTEQGQERVDAEVSYNNDTKTATLDPREDLRPQTTYVATVRSGQEGVKDRAGNALEADRIWSFTTADPPDTTPPDKPTVKLDPGSDSGASDSDGVTNDETPTFTGTAEAGSTVEHTLADGSVFKGTVRADEEGAYRFTVQDQERLPEGAYTITARAKDDAGNVSPASDPVSLRVDTTAPETSITSGPGDAVGNGTAEFGFSASEQDSSFECKLDGGDYEGCQSPKTYSGLADGSHTFAVRATDLAGNVDDSPAEQEFTLSTAGPEAPTITSPGNGSFNTSGNLTISGSAPAGATVELFDGEASRGRTEADADNGDWSISLTGVADGEHVYTARATDRAGKVSEASAELRVIVDTKAPNVTIDSGPSGTVANDSATFEFSADERAAFECKLDANEFQPCSSPKEYSALPNGEHTFTVKAIDAAGNGSQPVDRTWIIDVDRTPPTVSKVSPLPQATSVPFGTDVSATFSEEMDSSTINTNTFKLDKQGGSTVSARVTYNAATKTATLDPHNDLEAATTYVATVTTGVKDRAGNALETDRVWAFTTSAPPDTRAPVVTIDSKPAVTTNNVNPTFVFSADETATFECSLAKGTARDSFARCTSPKSYGPLSDASYTFKVRATDAAGNTSQAVSYPFKVDTARPAAPPQPDLVAARDTGVSNTDNITKATNLRFTGKAEANSQVGVYDRGELLGRSTASSSGVWTFQVTQSLDEGNHSITARATDAAGNISAASPALAVTIDLTRPTITNLAPAPGSSTSNRTPTIAATVQDKRTNLRQSNITLLLDGSKIGRFSYDRNSDRLTYKPKNKLSLGAHTAEIRAGDAAGNQESRTWRFTVVR
ncbi:MAG TPA: N,N-dimethylformamidase beta subunit family domain-containing protein [Rubrobacteraceae bacterium]|nr:N,N-dimethylformamidase beta subunit family domain-containing protein [Rubrobacteraceae bacterium]